MFEDLEPTVHHAIMKILSAIYETGMVDTVDMSDVLRLFGVPGDPDQVTVFSFNDPDWITAYDNFLEDPETPISEKSNTDEESFDEWDLGDLSSDRKLH